MTDATLVQELCATPSGEWPKRIRRHELVVAYLGLQKASTADVDRFAALAGMSRRMFYRLISIHKQRVAGCLPEPRLLSRGCFLEKESNNIIADAIASLPPDSACKTVVQEVRRLGRAHDKLEPSDFTIRARLKATGRIEGLQAKVGGRCSLIIDACCTDLILQEGHENVAPAWLAALVDAQAGHILQIAVSLGAPDLLPLADFLVTSHDQRRKPHLGETVIGVTSVVANRLIDLFTDQPNAGFAFRRLDGVLRSGEAMQFMLGGQIGRVRLRPRPRRVPPQRQAEGAPIDIASAVVDRLVSQFNAARATAS